MVLALNCPAHWPLLRADGKFTLHPLGKIGEMPWDRTGSLLVPACSWHDRKNFNSLKGLALRGMSPCFRTSHVLNFFASLQQLEIVQWECVCFKDILLGFVKTTIIVVQRAARIHYHVKFFSESREGGHATRRLNVFSNCYWNSICQR